MKVARFLKTQMKVAPLVGRRDFKGALQILEGELIGTDEDTPYLEIVAHCHLEAGNKEKAIETAKKTLQNNPTNFEMPRMLSQIYAESEAHEQAVEYVKIGLCNYPSEALPVPPVWAFGVLKLAGKLSARWKHVEEATKDDLLDSDKGRRDWQSWAKEYLVWYGETLKK